MKRYIATLVLAGALLCPSIVFADAVPLPNQPSIARLNPDNFKGRTVGLRFHSF